MFKQIINLFLVTVLLSSCQSRSLKWGDSTKNGAFRNPISPEASIILIPQWHLSPSADTKKDKKQRPQAQNQLAIYDQLSLWIQNKKVSSVVVEGCEKGMDNNYSTPFNGWNLKELQNDKSKIKSALTHVGIKLKARFGNKLDVVCGDNLLLIKKQLLAFSDLRGLLGFKIRIEQYKNDPKRKSSYLNSLRKLLKDTKGLSDKKLEIRLNTEIKDSFVTFKKLIKERNDFFIQKAKIVKKPTAIVIGAIHINDLKAKLNQQKLKYNIFFPNGLNKSETQFMNEVEELIKKLYNDASNT